MQSIKQFQNDQKRIYASVVSEPRQGLLMDIWNGQAQSLDDMKEVLDYSLLSIKENNLSCWLGEVSKLDALFDMDAESAEKYIIQHLDDTSLRKFAFIHKPTQKRHLDRIIRVFASVGIEVKTFATSVMAMQWLMLPTLVKNSKPVLEV